MEDMELAATNPHTRLDLKAQALQVAHQLLHAQPHPLELDPEDQLPQEAHAHQTATETVHAPLRTSALSDQLDPSVNQVWTVFPESPDWTVFPENLLRTSTTSQPKAASLARQDLKELQAQLADQASAACVDPKEAQDSQDVTETQVFPENKDQLDKPAKTANQDNPEKRELMPRSQLAVKETVVHPEHKEKKAHREIKERTELQVPQVHPDPKALQDSRVQVVQMVMKDQKEPLEAQELMPNTAHAQTATETTAETVEAPAEREAHLVTVVALVIMALQMLAQTRPVDIVAALSKGKPSIASFKLIECLHKVLLNRVS